MNTAALRPGTGTAAFRPRTEALRPRTKALRPDAEASRPACAASFRIHARLVAAWLLALSLGALGGAWGLAFAVDANTASADELQAIRGIGPAMAARIVEARRHEPFRDLEDLRDRVRGIGEKNLLRMRDAGLEVGAGAHMAEALGQGRVHEGPVGAPSPAARREHAAPPRPRVEYHVGRAR